MALLAVVAALPRVLRLGVPLADLDETWTWYHLQLARTEGSFWHPIGIGVDAPLFPAINQAVVHVFGSEIGALRLPQAAFGTLSVLLFYVLVRRLASESLAWRAALLMAVNPFFIYYAKDARPYSQLLFTCLLFTWAFFATATWRPRRRRAVLVALTVLAVASHYFALVYFAAFYAQRFWHHWRAGRYAELRTELRSGIASGVAVIPLVLLFLISFSRMSADYWTTDTIGIAAVTAEEWLFTGVFLAGDQADRTLTILHAIVFSLLVLPIIPVYLKRARTPGLPPVLNGLWFWAPAFVEGVDAFTSRRLMFFPRGFIASAPFLFTWWLAWTDVMPVRRWVRRVYQGVVLAPMLVAGLAVGASSQLHPMFLNRDVITQVVAQIHRYDGRFGRLVVHHWWIGQYFAYFYRGPATVAPLGIADRDVAPTLGEMEAVRRGIARLPPEEGVLLVENEVAHRYLDPHGEVFAIFAASRELLATIPCHPSGSAVPLLCTRMTLFGPVGYCRDAARTPGPP